VGGQMTVAMGRQPAVRTHPPILLLGIRWHSVRAGLERALLGEPVECPAVILDGNERPHPPFRLGDWIVRPDLQRLEGPAGEVRVEPKAMSVLLCLAEQPGRVCSKDQILEHAWRGVFVADSGPDAGRAEPAPDDGAPRLTTEPSLARIPELVWRFDAGSEIYPSAATSDGLVLVGGGKAVVALEASDGQERWRFATGGDVDTTPAVDATGRIYFGSRDDNVYALDLADGEERWRFPTGHHVLSGVVADESAVYFGSYDHRLYAVDAETGEELWHLETGRQVNNVTLAVTMADTTLYASSSDHFLYAVRLR